MSKKLSRIKFPVIRKLAVEDYALYPGQSESGDGIDHKFLKGVNLVIGINGLGKTTLLNIIYRLLIGPRDPKKDDIALAGVRSHELIEWRNRSYFSSRVDDGAEESVATAEISFGPKVLRIVRSLKDLSIIHLSVSGREYEENRENYEDLCLELSGVGSFYDFQYLIRNMVFFLEERRSLVWEEESQFEIFRILYSNSEQSQSFSTLYDEITDLDSRYRNLNWHTNRKEKDVSKMRRTRDSSDATTEKYDVLLAARNGFQKKAEDIVSEISALIDVKDDLVVRLEQKKLELEQAQRVCEGMQRALSD